MKIELTDRQVDTFLQEISVQKLSTYLAEHPAKSFEICKTLIFNTFNTASYMAAIYSILEEVPIQKELF